MSKTTIRRISKNIERVLNAELPGTGARVIYVVLPGRGLHRRHITQRAAQVLAYIEKRRAATSADLQRALQVNRNVIAGAMHELRHAGLVRSRRA